MLRNPVQPHQWWLNRMPPYALLLVSKLLHLQSLYCLSQRFLLCSPKKKNKSHIQVTHHTNCLRLRINAGKSEGGPNKLKQPQHPPHHTFSFAQTNPRDAVQSSGPRLGDQLDYWTEASSPSLLTSEFADSRRKYADISRRCR